MIKSRGWNLTRFLYRLGRIHPEIKGVFSRDEWLLLTLLCISLLIITQAFSAAAWLEVPSLTIITISAVFAGLFITKMPHSWMPLGHTAMSILGLVIAYSLTAATIGPTGSWANIMELSNRLMSWRDAVLNDAISTDTIPLGLAIGFLAWIIGYASSLATIRYKSLWFSLLPGTLTLVSMLSYLPQEFAIYLEVYLLVVLLLAIQICSSQQQEKWKNDCIEKKNLHNLSLFKDGLIFVFILFGIGVLLPIRPTIVEGPRDVWDQLREPVIRIETELNRLFPAIPSRKPRSRLDFKESLPFLGSISLGNTPLFHVEAETASYWRVRAYPVYTSTGWLQGNTETHDLVTGPSLTQPRAERPSNEYRYTVTLLGKTGVLPTSNLPIAGSHPLEATVPARQRVWILDQSIEAKEKPVSEQFQDISMSIANDITLLQSGVETLKFLERELPPDISITKIRVRDVVTGNEQIVETEPKFADEWSVDMRHWDVLAVAKYQELVANTFIRNDQKVIGIEITRLPPNPADILDVQWKSDIVDRVQFTLMSRSQIRPSKALITAGTDYSDWVSDRYLQLPVSLPDRVRELALTITHDATTPYYKALAIENYLRTIPYDQKISRPPFGSDGVDYFLFEVQKGYSTYFSSAMVVLLRSVGIPARLVAGYTHGDWNPQENVFVVKDQHRHAWPEVYFPNYGWVEFEPTPTHSLDPSTEVATESSQATDDPTVGRPINFNVDDDFDFEDPLNSIGNAEEASPIINPLIKVFGGITICIVLFAIPAWYLSQKFLNSIPYPQAAFEHMCRLARITGHGPSPNQTPNEYAEALSQEFPAIASEITFLGEVFTQSRYDKSNFSEEILEDATEAWNRIRRVLLFTLISRPSRFRMLFPNGFGRQP